MHESALVRFRSEIRHFYVVTLANVIFAAVMMAFGISVLVRQVVSIYESFTAELYAIFSPVVLFIALFAALMGLRWLLTSVRIFEGIRAIKDDLDEEGNEVSDESLTRFIVGMLSHYRNNRVTIHSMITVCTIGGICSLFLGIFSSLEHFSISGTGVEFTLNSYMAIPFMLLTIGIALISLASSYYFSRFTSVWDERLDGIEDSGVLLKETLEPDR